MIVGSRSSFQCSKRHTNTHEQEKSRRSSRPLGWADALRFLFSSGVRDDAFLAPDSNERESDQDAY